MNLRPLLLRALALFATAVLARAEVTGFDLASRTDVGDSGYEKIVGTLHFALDPAHPRNRVIADVGLAPVDAAGRVEFSADVCVLRPKAPATGNGTALLEVSNRGGKGLLSSFQRGAKSDPVTAADLGDGYLTRQGYTLVWVGWEFDVPPTPGLLHIHVPVATDHGRTITGRVSGLFTVDAPETTFAVTDVAAYPPAEAAAPDATLSVRASRTRGDWSAIPRDQWQLRGHVVTLAAGFVPGRAYQLVYTAANPPVPGLGFAAIRDAAAWLRQPANPVTLVRSVYAFGISQSGRFLRDFLYHGFNTDEHDRPVFDAVWAHIAGAARLDFNRRWATPRSLGLTPVTGFPFADSAQTDPVTGAKEGLLATPRVNDAPKIFYTNTSVEYAGGGRVAALAHTDPSGTRDLAYPDNVRAYFFAGTQHGPASFPLKQSPAAQELPNPANYYWAMRALLPTLHRWVTDGTSPPASLYPTFRDGTLVSAASVAFPAIPGVASPRALAGGPRAANPLLPRDGAGAPLPLLLPQVDADGNELAGLRLPEVAVPLATHTGWNFRTPAAGSPDETVMLAGSWIPFPPTRAARAAAHDPRRSVEERYASRADYLARFERAATALVQQHLLLAEDLPTLLREAGARWDRVTAAPPSGEK